MTCDVVVVGAGAAGLAAGQVLHKAGKHVRVLEAQQRVGGRVWSAHPWKDGLRVEWGAEVIHDCEAVDELWPEKEWPRTRITSDGRIAKNGAFRYRFGGSWVTESEYAGEMRKAIDEKYLPRRLGEHASLADAIARWPPRARAIAECEIEATYAAAPAQVSADWAWSTDDRWGRYRGDYRLAAPYDSVVQAMAGSLEIHLGDPVRSIARLGEGMAVATRGRAEYKASSVIVTVPLGVLKSGTIAFEPALSNERRVAIEGLGMGNVLKVAIRARKPFWGRLQYGACDAPVKSWWPGNRSVDGSAVLVGWAGGRSADQLSNLSRSGTLQAIRHSLQTLFPGHPKVMDEDIQFISWGKDEFVGGAYSYAPPGSEAFPDVLAAPEHDRLHFAGEATDAGFPTTVTGAVRSGQRAARAAMRALPV